MKSFNINAATTFLSLYLGILFLAYCLIFLWVCPSAGLATAVVVEIGVFCLSLLLLKKKLFTLPSWLTWLSRKFSTVTSTPRVTATIRSYRYARISILSLIALFASFDFVAFSTGAFCNSPITAQLYCLVPTSQLIGLRPASTLESLTGAFVQRGDLLKAESLYYSILEVRKQTTGPRSDLVAALYADLGDLNVRKHDLPSAARCYRQATILAPSSGRALTGLATTLRELGNFAESESYYLKALDCRSRTFGTSSRLYKDTLRGYMKLIARRGAHKVRAS